MLEVKNQNRYYQNDAVDATKNALLNSNINPIICMATGAGKSHVQKDLCAWIFSEFAGTRVMCLTHESGLIEQNHSKMPREYNAGIYSAGIGVRNTHNRIIFAGIQSVYKKANLFAPVGILIIDEIQLLSPNEDTMYMTFINGLREHNPNMIVLGLTATPFRSKEGMLSDCTFLDEIIYEYSMAQGIADAYLAPLTSKRGIVDVDYSSLPKGGNGEFNITKMAERFDRHDITSNAIEEIKAYGKNRNSWIIFCANQEHCHHVSQYLQDIPHGVITDKTDKDEKDRLKRDHKSGKIKCLICVAILTVGYDNPMVDLIVILRAIGSIVLYCQILGRGTRPVYADNMPLESIDQRLLAMKAGRKPHGCLVLDYGGNVERFGPVDKITIEKKYDKGTGEVKDTISIQPTKMCPECRCDNHIQAKTCPECGYDYPSEVKHASVASEAAILSADIEPEWHDVSDMMVERHKKAGSPDSLRITYVCGFGVKREWVAIQNQKAIKFASAWWIKRGIGDRPLSVDDALARVVDFKKPSRIATKPDGKFERICDYEDKEAEQAPLIETVVSIEDDGEIIW